MKLLDLFAGTGVGVAAHRLGIPEHGVEIWKPAIATREAVGFQTPYEDAWDIDRAEALDFDAMWASPPCQTFSVAGKGAGRKALDDVIDGVEGGRWKDIDSLRELGDEVGDQRTALVLTPLAYANRYRPRFIALEQVPTVLPVWNVVAEVLRTLGYSAWAGYLNSEQYGVPQTRKRAYLIARLDGEATPPTPTHSKYYARDPKRLDEGVKKWVSMAEALGWGLIEQPSPTLTSHLGVMRSPTGTQGVYLDAIERGEFDFNDVEPIPTKIATNGIGSKFAPNTVNVDEAEASVLQSYPRGLVSNYSSGSGGFVVEGSASQRGYRLADEPAFCLTSKMPHADEGGERRRIRHAEASAIQSYPAPFPFQGSKSDVSLQIGNAVPPLVAEAVLLGFGGN